MEPANEGEEPDFYPGISPSETKLHAAASSSLENSGRYPSKREEVNRRSRSCYVRCGGIIPPSAHPST